MMDDIGFLWYEDIVNENALKEEWLTIEREPDDDLKEIDDTRSERISIHCYLVQNDPQQIGIVNERQSWISIRADLCRAPENMPMDEDWTVKQYKQMYGVNLEQFIWYRDSEENYTVSPQFIDAYQLRLNKEKDTFQKDGLDIVKFSEPKQVKIRMDYLKDFLYKKQMCLVNNYNCKRRIKKNYLETIGKERLDKTIQSDNAELGDRFFYIHAGEDNIFWKNKGMTDSELMGHYIVFPEKRS